MAISMEQKVEGQEPEKSRRDLVQTLIEDLFLVIRLIHHGWPLQETILSPPQARLLFTIGTRRDEGISVKELAGKINVTPGAVT